MPRVLDLGPGRLLVYVLPPKVRALLTIAELLIWLFWPTANQPGPKQPQTLDQFSPDEPFLGPVVPYGPYMWTRQHRSYEIVIPPPGSPNPPVNVSNEWTTTDQAWISQLERVFIGEYVTETNNTVQRQISMGMQIRADVPEQGFVMPYGKFDQVINSLDGTVRKEGWETKFVSFSNGSPYPFPTEIPAPGQPWPLVLPEADPAAPSPLTAPVPEPLTRPAPAPVIAPPVQPPDPPVPNEAPPLAPNRVPSPAPTPTPTPTRPPVPTDAIGLTPNGRPALPPTPPPPTTPPGTTFLPGGVSLPNNGPQPTPQGTARELGKLEKKLESALAPEGPLSLLDKINRVIDQIENIKFVLDSLFPPGPYTYGAGQYGLTPVCERDENGAPLPDRVADWPSGEGEIVEVNAKLDALAQLIQFHKELKQPTCRGPAPTGEGVTVTFEQIE